MDFADSDKNIHRITELKAGRPIYSISSLWPPPVINISKGERYAVVNIRLSTFFRIVCADKFWKDCLDFLSGGHVLFQITLLSSPVQPRFPRLIHGRVLGDWINAFCHELECPKPVTAVSLKFFENQRDSVHSHRNY